MSSLAKKEIRLKLVILA